MLQCKTKNLYFKKKLGDLILFLRNGISNEQVDIYTDFPVTRIETIADGKIDYNRVGHVEKAPEDYRILQWDILVSNINSQKHIGKVAIKDDDKVLYHGMNLLLMRPNETIDSKFLFYVLNFNKQYFERIASPAVNQSSINQTDMQKMEFIIPKDKSKQEQIADILSTCDEVIEKTEETIEKYKQIKAGMMQDLFTRGLDENGKLRPAYAQSPDLYKYSKELDRYIPKEWDIINKLEDCTIKIGDGIHTTPKYCENSNFYFVNGNNLVDDKINTDNNANNIPESEYNRYKLILNEYTLLLSINGTIGNLAFYNNDNVVFGKSICYICCKNKYILDYLYHYFQTDFIKAFYDYELTGSTIKNLSLNSIRNLKFAIPKTEKEISDITKVLYKIHKKIIKEEQYLNKYKQIKQGLMKQLLTPPADAEIVEE